MGFYDENNKYNEKKHSNGISKLHILIGVCGVLLSLSVVAICVLVSMDNKGKDYIYSSETVEPISTEHISVDVVEDTESSEDTSVSSEDTSEEDAVISTEVTTQHIIIDESEESSEESTEEVEISPSQYIEGEDPETWKTYEFTLDDIPFVLPCNISDFNDIDYHIDYEGEEEEDILEWKLEARSVSPVFTVRNGFKRVEVKFFNTSEQPKALSECCICYISVKTHDYLNNYAPEIILNNYLGCWGSQSQILEYMGNPDEKSEYDDIVKCFYFIDNESWAYGGLYITFKQGATYQIELENCKY